MPEVETVKRVLEPQLQGLTIDKVVAERPEVIAYPKSEEFCSRLAGQGIEGIERRGKFLLMQLSGGGRLIFHLRMTGCLLVSPADAPKEKHTHLLFQLCNVKQLHFSDTRRFGRSRLIQKGEADHSGIEKLGKKRLTPLLRRSICPAAWERCCCRHRQYIFRRGLVCSGAFSGAPCEQSGSGRVGEACKGYTVAAILFYH